MRLSVWKEMAFVMMRHVLPNGAKRCPFFFAFSVPSASSLRFFAHHPKSWSLDRESSRKKSLALDEPVCLHRNPRETLQRALKEGSHAALVRPRSVQWKPWGRFAEPSPRWRASNRARSPATSTKPTACPRRRSSERCVKPRANALSGSNLDFRARRRRRGSFRARRRRAGAPRPPADAATAETTDGSPSSQP